MRRPLLLALLAAAMAAAVVAAAPADPAPADGPTFYISADQVEWRFAPNPDVDMCSGQAFNGGSAGPGGGGAARAAG